MLPYGCCGSICKNSAVLFTFHRFYGIISLIDKLEFDEGGYFVKKIIALVLALLYGLALISCSAEAVLNDISSTKMIEIYDYETDTSIEITDQETINRICENILSLKLSKMHYNKPTSSVYTLTFFDTNGNQIEVVGIPSHNWIRCNDAFYNITEGQFDREYIATLFD